MPGAAPFLFSQTPLEETTFLPTKCRRSVERPPAAEASPSLRPRPPLFFSGRHAPPHMPQESSQSPPPHASPPPVSETRSASGPATPPTPAAHASPLGLPSRRRRKKSPLSEKERGPGLTPKTRGCAPYASGSKSSGKSALVYTFCTSSSSSSASVMRMSFCAVSASTGTSMRGTMAS